MILQKCLVKRKKCPEFSFGKFKSSRKINTEHLSFDLMDERNIKFRFTITMRIIFNDKNTGNRREAIQFLTYGIVLKLCIQMYLI